MPKFDSNRKRIPYTERIDQRFGRLTILEYIPSGRFWCLCDCGVKKNCQANALIKGNIKSCGCLGVESRKTHGLSHLPEYKIWESIKARCSNPNHKRFPHYGGRGITMCPEWWDDFAAFYAYVGPRPSEKHTIDRIDNDRGYEPRNVRWATDPEQRRNTSRNQFYTFNGVTLCITDWAEIVGIRHDAMTYRLKNWSLERAMTEPAYTHCRNRMM